MATTSHYQLGAAYARSIFTKEAIVGAMLGANEARHINPEDPRYLSGAVLGELGADMGGVLGGTAGGIGGVLAGAALGLPIGLATHNPEMMRNIAAAGATTGVGLGGLGGYVMGGQWLPRELLGPRKTQ